MLIQSLIVSVPNPRNHLHSGESQGHLMHPSAAAPAFIQPVLDTYRAVDSNAVFARN
jgi:hypothetical protein